MPWLGYLHKIAVCETFVILDDVQFEKNSFINRNYIMSHNGPILLTVPIKLKPKVNLINSEVCNFFPKFKFDCNKYDKGHVLVLGGEMPGASRIVASNVS